MSVFAFLARIFARAAVGVLAGWGTPALAILAGVAPDTPAARVDPNVATSVFSGVVSINIRYSSINGQPQSFICSGTLVSRRHVITAGHCIDTDGQGHKVDISVPGNDVRVVFNATASAPGNAVVTASAVSMHPNFQGFGNCPLGVSSFCVNDDIAVITLGQDAPASARTYPIYAGIVGIPGTQVTLAGYGTSGDGINGFTIGPNFRIKRSGGNVLDLFEGDDEQFSGFDPNGFLRGGGIQEVWYADFDGTNSSGALMNSACTFFGVCTPQLANGIETNMGGGDQGGPAFVTDGLGDLLLIGHSTFGFSGFGEENPGAFGALFGGMLLEPYLDYLYSATDGAVVVFVPEPGTLSLMVLALALAVVGAARRRSAA